MVAESDCQSLELIVKVDRMKVIVEVYSIPPTFKLSRPNNELFNFTNSRDDVELDTPFCSSNTKLWGELYYYLFIW